MSDLDEFSAAFIFTTSIIKGLNEKNVEKRKHALEELEKHVIRYKKFMNSENIMKIFSFLDVEFLSSNIPLLRKSGLMSVLAIISGIKNISSENLEIFLDFVISCFTDQDATVRLSACETCINIVNIIQKNILVFIDKLLKSLITLSVDADINVKNISNALSHLLMDVFIRSKDSNVDKIFPLIIENLYPINLQSKIFIISWITFLVNQSPIDALKYLPIWLDGIMNIYSDNNSVLQIKVERLLDMYIFLLEKNLYLINVSKLMDILFVYTNNDVNHVKYYTFKWILIIIELYEIQLIKLIPHILNCVFTYLSTKNQQSNISEKCQEINLKLKHLVISSEVDSNTKGLINISIFSNILKKWLKNEHESTVLMVIGWNVILLENLPCEYLNSLSIIYENINNCILSDSHMVIESALILITKICTASGNNLESNCYFEIFIRYLVTKMEYDEFKILKNKSTYIVRTVCKNLDPLIFFRKVSCLILEIIKSNNISTIVHHLNIILLTLDQTKSLRNFLIHGELISKRKAFDVMFKCWAYNPASALSLCLICSEYILAFEIVKCFQYIEPTIEYLLEFDHLIQIIESPNFTFLRLALLDVNDGKTIRNTLCGLLMILPQSNAFHILRKRLKCLPTFSSIDLKNEKDDLHLNIMYVEYIEHFKSVNKIS